MAKAPESPSISSPAGTNPFEASAEVATGALSGLPELPNEVIQQRRFRVFLILAGIFLATLAMLNILGITRFIVIASYTPGEEGSFAWAKRGGTVAFAVAVGVLPYPVTFLCTDLISEFYGRKRANFLVFVGLLVNLWVIFVLWIGGTLPEVPVIDAATNLPAADDSQYAFYYVRKLAFGAVAASMIAYLAAQFVDVQIFHFWKRVTKGKHLWLRNNGSTIISQFIDTFAVIVITHFYAHALPVDVQQAIWPQLWVFIATGFVFKLVIALVDTPLIYLAVHGLRRYLRHDSTTNTTMDLSV